MLGIDQSRQSQRKMCIGPETDTILMCALKGHSHPQPRRIPSTADTDGAPRGVLTATYAVGSEQPRNCQL